MTGSLAPNEVAHFVAYLFGGTLQLVLFPEWALKRERRRNRRSGLPTKHLHRLGVVRDENTLSVAAQHDDTGPGSPDGTQCGSTTSQHRRPSPPRSFRLHSAGWPESFGRYIHGDVRQTQQALVPFNEFSAFID